MSLHDLKQHLEAALDKVNELLHGEPSVPDSDQEKAAEDHGAAEETPEVPDQPVAPNEEVAAAPAAPSDSVATSSEQSAEGAPADSAADGPVTNEAGEPVLNPDEPR